MKKYSLFNPRQKYYVHAPSDEQHEMLEEIYKDRSIIAHLSRVLNESDACQYSLDQVRASRRKLTESSYLCNRKDIIKRRSEQNQEITFICTQLNRNSSKDLL